MAQLEFDIPPDLLEQLNKLGDPGKIEGISKKMLNEAAPILVAGMKKECERHKDTGEMAESIAQTVKAKAAKGGGFITVVRPHGNDKKGVRNMDKLAYIEYGTSKQAADPVISPTIKKAEAKVIETMRNVFDREVEM